MADRVAVPPPPPAPGRTREQANGARLRAPNNTQNMNTRGEPPAGSLRNSRARPVTVSLSGTAFRPSLPARFWGFLGASLGLFWACHGLLGSHGLIGLLRACSLSGRRSHRATESRRHKEARTQQPAAVRLRSTRKGERSTGNFGPIRSSKASVSSLALAEPSDGNRVCPITQGAASRLRRFALPWASLLQSLRAPATLFGPRQSGSAEHSRRRPAFPFSARRPFSAQHSRQRPAPLSPHHAAVRRSRRERLASSKTGDPTSNSPTTRVSRVEFRSFSLLRSPNIRFRGETFIAEVLRLSHANSRKKEIHGPFSRLALH